MQTSHNPLRLVPTRMPPRPMHPLVAHLHAIVCLPGAVDITNISIHASGLCLSNLLHASFTFVNCRACKLMGPTLPSITSVLGDTSLSPSFSRFFLYIRQIRGTISVPDSLLRCRFHFRRSRFPATHPPTFHRSSTIIRTRWSRDWFHSSSSP